MDIKFDVALNSPCRKDADTRGKVWLLTDKLQMGHDMQHNDILFPYHFLYTYQLSLVTALTEHVALQNGATVKK